MANYTPPASFPASHATFTSQSQSQATSSSVPSTDISPSSLDTLPVLSAILTRLQTNAPPPNNNASPQPSQSQTQTHTQTLPAPSTSSPAPLFTKDIPAATDDLKRNLQKARMQVAKLPDMDRGIAEQEDEIRELDARIREQRRVLELLKTLGRGEGMET